MRGGGRGGDKGLSSAGRRCFHFDRKMSQVSCTSFSAITSGISAQSSKCACFVVCKSSFQFA